MTVMNRRNFLTNTSTLALGASMSASTSKTVPSIKPVPFGLDYAPHFGMFESHAGADLIDQLKFMKDQGFEAIEDNEMRNRPIDEQKRIAKQLEKSSMRMGVFVAHKIYWSQPNLTSGQTDYREEFLAYIKGSIETAKRVNAKWMTVVPGHVDLSLDVGYQTANLVETLRQASALLEPHGLVMVLEPLNFRDHPGQFLQKASQAFEICKAVDSPSCKILYDVYHQQIQEGNLIPNIEASWSQIAYFQVGDNPGRKEPTTGEINYKNVFKYIHESGYQGIIGMEHGNSKAGKKGELQVINSYRSIDILE